MGSIRDFRKGKFSREEFDKHFIKDDDITLTSCCKRKWYRTKKHLKCAKCKKIVDDDIAARSVMQGIDKMMRARDEKERAKNSGSSEAKNDKS